MTRSTGKTLIILAVVLALPAVLLARHPAVRAAPVPGATGTRSHDPFQALLARSHDLGPVAAQRTVSFLLLLRDPGAARQAADLAAMYDPRSRHYGHFKTAAQYAAIYGPSPVVVACVRSFVQRAGLATRWERGDTWMVVMGPAGRIDQVFQVQIHDYIAPTNVRFYASARTPTVPVPLRGAVRGAGHISSYVQPQRFSAPVGGLTPADVLAAYDMEPLRKLGLDGSGQTVVFWEIDAFDQKDLDQFTRRFHLPDMHPLVKGDALRSADAEGEADMDLQVVHAIAPKARLVVYNLDMTNLFRSAQSDQDLSTKFFAFQNRIVRDNHGAIVSVSLGFCDQIWGASGLSDVWKRVYDEADQLGESVFVASGDSGAYGCLSSLAKRGTPPSDATLGVTYPAAAPGAIAVGGTRLSVQEDHSWYNETVWEDPAETEGTGGGLSYFHPRPSWQHAPGTDSQYANGKREVPDVSADADSPSSAAVVVKGTLGPVGGTSQAAPIWAGMTALINQYLQRQHQQPLGFMNPALYHLAAGRQPYPPFHDVTVGTNLYYPATRGYDLATGLGTPDAWNLARDLAAYQRGSQIAHHGAR